MSDRENNGDISSLPMDVGLTLLDNGLTVITREDHSAPVVSAQAWCMAGSIHEGRWLGAGLSHILEHMLFKGTASRPGSRIDQEVQEAGGYMNAYTSFDRTVYHIDVPNTGASVALDILCDIMQHATLPPDELARELDVIRREMDMGQDDPARRSSRRLFETAYTKSPYRYTIIGYPDIFNEVKPDDVRAYYHEKYAPNNVFYVVVGDVATDVVLERIRAAYHGAKARPLPPYVLPAEPRQTASREVIEEAPVELGHLHVAWHIPDLRHPDVPALEVLSVLLGHGRSSRLYQRVREKQGLVHHADAWTYNPGNPGLFGMSAVVDAGRYSAASGAMLAELEAMKDGTVSPDEISKAVKQFVSGTLASRKTMQGQAQDLGGSWLAASDLYFTARYLEAIKRVTGPDLARVAREYLTTENRTAYALLPRGALPKPVVATSVPGQQAVQKLDLAGGLRLLVKEDHRLPFVEFRAVFQGGVLRESTANNGITQLMARTLLKGTARRSAEDIARDIESVGGSLDSYAGNNSFGVQAEVLSSDAALGLELLAEVILAPAFRADAMEREREVQLAHIRAQRDHLLQSASHAMRRELFGNAGYGLNPLGSEESLAALQPADLANWHRQFAAPDRCVLAVFGDVTTVAIQAAVEKAFAGWRPASEKPRDISNFKFQISNSPRRVEESRDKKQAVLVVGFPGTTLHDADRYPLELIHEACSDLGSRLFLRVRERLGLAYYVGAQHFPGLAPGCFSFYAGTAPEKARQVEEELFLEAKLLRTEGLSEAELKRAKAKIIGQRKIARQDLGALATTVALDELYGLGYAHSEREDALYEAVTLDQVKVAAEKYLRPDAAVVAVVRPE
jgi:zinc protease